MRNDKNSYRVSYNPDGIFLEPLKNGKFSRSHLNDLLTENKEPELEFLVAMQKLQEAHQPNEYLSTVALISKWTDEHKPKMLNCDPFTYSSCSLCSDNISLDLITCSCATGRFLFKQDSKYTRILNPDICFGGALKDVYFNGVIQSVFYTPSWPSYKTMFTVSFYGTCSLWSNIECMETRFITFGHYTVFCKGLTVKETDEPAQTRVLLSLGPSNIFVEPDTFENSYDEFMENDEYRAGMVNGGVQLEGPEKSVSPEHNGPDSEEEILDNQITLNSPGRQKQPSFYSSTSPKKRFDGDDDITKWDIKENKYFDLTPEHNDSEDDDQNTSKSPSRRKKTTSYDPYRSNVDAKHTSRHKSPQKRRKHVTSDDESDVKNTQVIKKNIFGSALLVNDNDGQSFSSGGTNEFTLDGSAPTRKQRPPMIEESGSTDSFE